MLYQEMNTYTFISMSVYDLPGDYKYFYFCRDEYFYS